MRNHGISPSAILLHALLANVLPGGSPARQSVSARPPACLPACLLVARLLLHRLVCPYPCTRLWLSAFNGYLQIVIPSLACSDRVSGLLANSRHADARLKPRTRRQQLRRSPPQHQFVGRAKHATSKATTLFERQSSDPAVFSCAIAATHPRA